MSQPLRTLVRDLAVGEGVQIETPFGVLRLALSAKKGSRVKCRIEAPPQLRITMIRNGGAPESPTGES